MCLNEHLFRGIGEKMDFERDNVRMVVKEDRLSSLPDDLIQQILSYIGIKFAVRTSSLSSRWKFLWTSMPHLSFCSDYFDSLPKFSKFVTHVLTHRNPQIEVSSVQLDFTGAASQVFVRKIANYAFSHNVKTLSVSCFPKKHHKFPHCLFNSQSLEHLTLRTQFLAPCVTPKSPWNFPALITLHLSEITLCDQTTDGEKSIDLFSMCVNLKNLTLKCFFIMGVEVFDIITPRLSNLTLIDGRRCPEVVNLIAPQLENLTIMDCGIKYINVSPGLASLCYRGCPMQLSTDGFHSLSKVTLHLRIYSSYKPYEEEEARKTINMLQELHSAKFLTLNTDIVECLSLFPNLLSYRYSPFRNLKFLKIKYIEFMVRKDAHKITMSTQVRNFLLENSPSATFIMELPEEPPTKAMKQKEARAKKMAKQREEIERLMAELQLLMEQGKNSEIERTEKKANQKSDFVSLLAQLMVLLEEEMEMQSEPERAKVELRKAEMKMQVEGQPESETSGRSTQCPANSSDLIEARTEGEMAQVGVVITKMKSLLEEMQVQVDQDYAEVLAFFSKKSRIKELLEKLPKRQRAELETRYPQHLEETEAWFVHLLKELVHYKKVREACIEMQSDYITRHSAICSSELPSASQPPPLTRELYPRGVDAATIPKQ